jgi:Raf kinase inhibitor-like YbhB/YbcL family protein
MRLESDVFVNNGTIPVEYTCNGASKPISLKISDVPGNTKSLALIVDDPDAPSGDFVHWVVWNIDPKTTFIESKKLMNAVEGYTSLGKPGWVAPCPPSCIHHYHFKLYALDTIFSMPNSSTKKDLVKAMAISIIDSAILTGLYGRKTTS